MSLGSISSSTVSAALEAARQESARLGGAKKAEGGTAVASATIADHVAAADEREPIRSLSTTQGTLLDTYL
jgi:hypothetical protein